jgi:hypothetical protein
VTTETELAEYAERIHMEAELNEWIEHTVLVASLEQMTQSEEEVLDFLEHFGVKGQQWGVRKPRGDRSAFKKKAKPTLPDLSKMSNEDLRAAVSRLQLEKQFRDLSKPQSKTFTGRGSKFAAEVLKDIGKQHARKIIVEGAAVIATGAAVAWRMSKM